MVVGRLTIVPIALIGTRRRRSLCASLITVLLASAGAAAPAWAADEDAVAPAPTAIAPKGNIVDEVVVTASVSREVLRMGYELADEVLVGLLRKIVVLGRVPDAAELDDLAASASL